MYYVFTPVCWVLVSVFWMSRWGVWRLRSPKLFFVGLYVRSTKRKYRINNSGPVCNRDDTDGIGGPPYISRMWYVVTYHVPIYLFYVMYRLSFSKTPRSGELRSWYWWLLVYMQLFPTMPLSPPEDRAGPLPPLAFRPNCASVHSALVPAYRTYM